MAAILRAAAVAALAGVLAAPSAAHARFGKRSADSEESRSDSDKKSKPHRAVPAGSQPQARPDGDRNHDRHSPGRDHSSHRHHDGHVVVSRPSVHVHPAPVVYVAPEPVYYASYSTYPSYSAPAPAAAVQSSAVRADPDPIDLTLDLAVQGHTQGGNLAAAAALEGERFGVNAGFTGIFAWDGATYSLDALQVVDAHFTWALLSGRAGKLRLEGGISSAFAPDLTVAGPDAGISLQLGRDTLFGLDASTHLTAFPHVRFDAQAGIGMKLGHGRLVAGWRHLWLDDRGLVDGERHTDSFSGPFAGLSLRF